MLGHASLGTVDIFDMMLSGYRPGMSKGAYIKMRKRIEKRHNDLQDDLKYAEERRKFNSLISKMHIQGLIKKENEKERSSMWKITKEGDDKLYDLIRKSDRLKGSFLPPDLPREYKTEEGHSQIIVIFDIPEKERNKRDWFRDILKNLEFKKIQESVMIGKNKIPE